jgi:uncharacterized membrane protein (DUF2068 family)
LNHPGLRAIAVLEAAKGLLVLAAGAGLHHAAHRDVRALAVQLIHQFHLNPASHYPSIFLGLMDNVTDTRLQMLALGALAYATLRLTEAYGLWMQRRWAEWLAVIAAGIYIPFELYHLWLRITAVKLCLLALNVVLVVYLARVLSQSRQKKHPVTHSGEPRA